MFFTTKAVVLIVNSYKMYVNVKKNHYLCSQIT